MAETIVKDLLRLEADGIITYDAATRCPSSCSHLVCSLWQSSCFWAA